MKLIVVNLYENPAGKFLLRKQHDKNFRIDSA